MKLYSGHYVLVCFAILTSIVAGLGYYLLYQQVVAQAESSSQAVRAVESEAERKLEEEQLLKLYADTELDRAKLASSFVQEDKIVEFIEEVEAIGPITNTTLELSALAKEEGKISAHVDVKGSWTSVMRSLLLIENMPYSISVKGIRLTLTEKVWNLNLDFSVLSM